MLKIEKSVCKKILNSFYNSELQFGNGTGGGHDYNDDDDDDDDKDNEIDCKLSLINFDETAGFLGKHLRLFIRHKCDTISAFVKLLPDNAENNFGYSKIEILFYQEILPKLKLRHKLCPKPFYLNLSEEIIILEDISQLEFKMVNKFQGFDYSQSVEILKTLARFHSSSISLAEDLFECFDSKIKTHRISNRTVSIPFLEASIKSIAAVADLVPEIDSKLFRAKLQEIYEIDFKNLHTNQSYCRVLNHGDLWPNNILLKETANSENKYQVMLVDFQLICFAPPAYDILKFYLLSVNKQTKNEYGLKHFLNIYYDELEKHVLNLDLMLTRCQLHKCASIFWRAFLLDAAISSTVIFLNELVYKNLFQDEHGFRRFMLTEYRTEIVSEAFSSDVKFRSVITDLVVQIANSIPA